MQSDEIKVDQPLESETIREADEGVLVTCHETHCDWQDLFPMLHLPRRP
ncbi:hypothetical protein Htur_4518 (plasmid) [Haloterrigena turkmenica DSM 5511]|uniref:Uncharacterized protein n=1 Tax=Haloterrigena turkmenica (strain ATCC 51198 / DSM 5511 / JCM 9101 / NCIMB 13204 / VKM B-1734 / 4k) TaxID=543526 RepID=D2S1S8_HALTV|nr:hypothetical protein [Haloterrigena turkmenica]ADB63325.1 hypothetical protein Htur_4518 [Haloterrigena turkmenica DSM 5511]